MQDRDEQLSVAKRIDVTLNKVLEFEYCELRKSMKERALPLISKFDLDSKLVKADGISNIPDEAYRETKGDVASKYLVEYKVRCWWVTCSNNRTVDFLHFQSL